MPPLQTISVTEQEVERICGLEEGQFCDLKGYAISPADLTKAISAFANSDGGDLYVGIEDKPRQWLGFMHQELANGAIQIFDQLFPLGNDFTYSFLKCPSKSGFVLHVHVNKTARILKASNGIPYIRRNAQNLPQKSHEEIRRLENTKGVTTHETEPLNIPKQTITESKLIKEFINNVVPHSEPEEWLKKQLLIREERPTVAGALLFADEPQIFMPKHCGVKIYQYKTTNAEGSRETLTSSLETIEGPLLPQIKKAVDRTREIVESTSVFSDDQLIKTSYPTQALHEIITNAIIHRDYSIADDVHVRIFDNRVEVQSPGALPAHVTVQNIYRERFARNGTIVRILNKFPDAPNKDIGEGLKTAIHSLHKLGLKDPVIEEKGNNVLVTIKHESMATAEEAIMDYLVKNETINNREARRIVHITENYRIKRIFARMVKAGFIERVPNTKTINICYRKKQVRNGH